MNNYLLQLLKEIKTIIIPGLGAITLTNEATGEMMFMPYLKYDDGNLARHISEKEGMDLNDAKNLIAKFVREVTAELDKGNSYDMYQFGSFKKVDGDVAFLQWNPGAVSEPAPELTAPAEVAIAPEPEIVPEPVQEIIPEPVIEPKPTPEPAAAIKEEPELTEPVTDESTTVAVVAEIIAEELPAVAAPEVTPDPPKAETPPPPPIAEQKKPEEPAKKPEPAKKTPTPKEQLAAVEAAKKADRQPVDPKQPQPKKKTRVLSYILWGFVVLLLGGATYVAINFETMKKDFPLLADLAGDNDAKAIHSKDIHTVLDEDSTGTAMDSTDQSATEEPEPTQPEVVEPEPTPEVMPEPEPVKPVVQPQPVTPKKPRPKSSNSGGSSGVSIGSPDPSKPFHVIGGSFGSEANAKRFARELIGKGQQSVVVGEFNGMYRVSIVSFATKEEAVQAYGSLKEIVPQAWVFKWP